MVILTKRDKDNVLGSILPDDAPYSYTEGAGPLMSEEDQARVQDPEEVSAPAANSVLGTIVPRAPESVLGTIQSDGKPVYGGSPKDMTQYQKNIAQDEIKNASTPEEVHRAYVDQDEANRAGEWGKPGSSHPGVLGKIFHGLAKAGNIAGDIVAPSTMAIIPGTDLNKQITRNFNEQRDLSAIEDQDTHDFKQAQTNVANATAKTAGAKTPEEQFMYDALHGNNGRAKLDSEGKPYDYLSAHAAWRQVENDSKPTPKATKQDQLDNYAGLRTRVANGEQLSTDETKNLKKLQTEFSVGEHDANDSNGRILRMLQSNPELKKQYNAVPTDMLVNADDTPAEAKQKEDFAKGLVGSGTSQQKITIQNEQKDTAATQHAVDVHDKAYVQPANGVEKSYEMMDAAFNEYEAARAQGKTLPTGAQSMLALSTHLATTFGNVKGSRVTKDMIQEHLGARGVSDRALAAIQGFTNGDVLSPDQWEAFHDLISQSRTFAWETAVREADRKHIPVDFLPEGLAAVKIPGHKAGVIPSSNLGAFHKKYPNALDLT